MAAFKQAPEIAKTQFDWAFLASKGALINATQPNTPHRTGMLGNPKNWTGVLEPLSLSWSPNMIYAAAVEFGMPASPGRYVPAIGKRLKNPNRAGFGMWPGFKANPFMERIADAATPQIQGYFEQALEKITQQIADA